MENAASALSSTATAVRSGRHARPLMDDFLRGARNLVGAVSRDAGKAAKGAFEAAQDALEAAKGKERPADFGPACSRSEASAKAAGAPPEAVSVLVGSWNVMGQRVSNQDDLADWLLGWSEPSSGPRSEVPDVIALGMQELVDLNPAHCVMKQGGDFDREDDVDTAILQCLQRHGRYVKVRSVGMIGLYLVCYVKEGLDPHVYDVDADRVRTTAEGPLAGKKGAVAIKLSIGQSSLCFVNVHLPSGQERTEERSAALRQVMGEAFQGINMLGSARPPKLGFKRESRYCMSDHAGAFIFGDFNFRLTISPEELPKRLTVEDCAVLRAFDPSLSGRVDPALAPFTEGQVDFPPTYKYKVGTDTLDESRLPAWTDRIFFRGASTLQLHYGAHTRLRHTSDHRPVSGLFTVSLNGGVKAAASLGEPARIDTNEGAA